MRPCGGGRNEVTEMNGTVEADVRYYVPIQINVPDDYEEDDFESMASNVSEVIEAELNGIEISGEHNGNRLTGKMSVIGSDADNIVTGVDNVSCCPWMLINYVVRANVEISTPDDFDESEMKYFVISSFIDDAARQLEEFPAEFEYRDRAYYPEIAEVCSSNSKATYGHGGD